MASLRDARAAVIRRRYRALMENFDGELPRLLDDLEQADRNQLPSLVVNVEGELSEEQLAELHANVAKAVKGRTHVISEPSTPTDAEIEAWIEANPEKFAAWYRKQARIHGTADWAMPGAGEPVKPQPRRRTTRKADGL